MYSIVDKIPFTSPEGLMENNVSIDSYTCTHTCDYTRLSFLINMNFHSPRNSILEETVITTLLALQWSHKKRRRKHINFQRYSNTTAINISFKKVLS